MIQHQRALWQLCYRLTGSAADADDLVQETFRRALEHPPADLTRDLRPWLVRVAVNLGRDMLRARKRRGYIGPWLPTPVETPDASALSLPSDARYSERESLSQAFLVALEALSATQRAVLLLRDVLDYSVEETAAALDLSEANVKTTLHRARKVMASYDAEALPLTPERIQRTQEVLRALCMHLLTHNVPALEALLAEGVCARNDGAGEFFAAQRPVFGVARVIKFHLKTMRRHGRARMAIRNVNGMPALVVDAPSQNPRIASRAVLCIALDREGKIMRMDTIVASQKLKAIDFASLPEPNWRLFASMARAAVRHPHPRAWLPGLMQKALVRPGFEALSKRVAKDV